MNDVNKLAAATMACEAARLKIGNATYQQSKDITGVIWAYYQEFSRALSAEDTRSGANR